jgi:hypothetical protein
MRGDAARQLRAGGGGGGGVVDADGRNSPVVQSNGQQQQSSPPPLQPTSLDSSSLHPQTTATNGTSSVLGRTGSFSYSSILASTPNSQTPSGEGQGGNGVHGNHDRPFKYSRDEMLSIWKNNASRLRYAGIPLEFEKHEAFTSEDPLDPALLTEMTPAEKEVCTPLVMGILTVGFGGTFEFG